MKSFNELLRSKLRGIKSQENKERSKLRGINLSSSPFMERAVIKIISIIILISFSNISLGGIVLGPKKNVLAQYIGKPLAATLNVELKRISDNAVVPINHMTFPITTTPNFGVDNPWLVANQYIYIEYDCNYPCWGIKIITDNKKNIDGVTPKPIGIGKVSYSGLINIDKKDNPTYRADLAWQINKNFLGNGKLPAQPLTDHALNPSDPDNKWKSAWAYIADKGNTDYIPNSIITGWTEDGGAIYNYDVAIFGDGTSSALAWHPYYDPDGDPTTKEGNGHEAIYIGARFCSTDYTLDPDNPVDFVLPQGGYETIIYIEFISE